MGLWDWRILALFLTATVTHLNTLRCFFLQIQKRQLYLEWLHYLWSAHSMQYSSCLQHHSCWSGVTCRPPTRGGNSNNGFKLYCRSCAQDNDIRKYKVENLLVSEYFLTDMRSGTVAVSKYLNASYWDWCDGSSLLFWRWPFEFCAEA